MSRTPSTRSSPLTLRCRALILFLFFFAFFFQETARRERLAVAEELESVKANAADVREQLAEMRSHVTQVCRKKRKKKRKKKMR